MAGSSIGTLIEGRHPPRNELDLGMGDGAILVGEVAHGGTWQILVSDEVKEAACLVGDQRQGHFDVSRKSMKKVRFAGAALVPGDRWQPGVMKARLSGSIAGRGTRLCGRQRPLVAADTASERIDRRDVRDNRDQLYISAILNALPDGAIEPPPG